MEAAFEVVSHLSDIRHETIVISFIFFSSKIEVDLISKEIFHEKVHYLGIFFKLEVIVIEHAHTPSH